VGRPNLVGSGDHQKTADKREDADPGDGGDSRCSNDSEGNAADEHRLDGDDGADHPVSVQCRAVPDCDALGDRVTGENDRTGRTDGRPSGVEPDGADRRRGDRDRTAGTTTGGRFRLRISVRIEGRGSVSRRATRRRYFQGVDIISAWTSAPARSRQSVAGVATQVRTYPCSRCRSFSARWGR